MTGAAWFAYDAAGNMNQDGTSWYSFDVEDRISTVGGGTATYTYGPDGERVRKLANSASTEYIYFDGEPIAEKGNTGAWTDYIFVGGSRIASATGNTSARTQYYHADHLGTARIVTDSAGNRLDDCTYAPYGQLAGCLTNTSGNHYKFTGKERDQQSGESGLDYFGARYYASGMGRWMTPDWGEAPEPIPYADSANPQTLNLYSYSQDNPMIGPDIDGHVVHVCTLVPQLCQAPPEAPPVEINPYAYMEPMLIAGLAVSEIHLGVDIFKTGKAIEDAKQADQESIDAEHKLNKTLEASASTGGGKKRGSNGGAKRPPGVPNDWKAVASRNGETKRVDPSNPHNYVRQRSDGSLTQVKDGMALDAAGNKVPQNSPAAHYSANEFTFRDF